EIAHGDLFQVPRLDGALVQPLEPPAEERDARTGGKFAYTRLRQRLAAWGEIDLGRAVRRRIERGTGHVGAHHHARTAAGWRVVHRAMFAEPVFADVAHVERPEILLQRFAEQRCA